MDRYKMKGLNRGQHWIEKVGGQEIVITDLGEMTVYYQDFPVPVMEWSYQAASDTFRERFELFKEA